MEQFKASLIKFEDADNTIANTETVVAAISDLAKNYHITVTAHDLKDVKGFKDHTECEEHIKLYNANKATVYAAAKKLTFRSHNRIIATGYIGNKVRIVEKAMKISGDELHLTIGVNGNDFCEANEAIRESAKENKIQEQIDTEHHNSNTVKQQRIVACADKDSNYHASIETGSSINKAGTTCFGMSKLNKMMSFLNVVALEKEAANTATTEEVETTDTMEDAAPETEAAETTETVESTEEN